MRKLLLKKWHRRKKRLQEMQEAAEKNKYGEVTQISKPDFVREVTEASKSCWVVVHLFKDEWVSYNGTLAYLFWHAHRNILFHHSIPACKLMNQHLSVLAREFKATKFLKIISDQCIPNYPDRNVPTLLVYGDGDIKANIVGAIAFGGMAMTVSSKLHRRELWSIGLTGLKLGTRH